MKKFFTLRGGVKIPAVGFGTWQTPDGCIAISSVKTACCCGYRHIDTAAAYHNEGSVGTGIQNVMETGVHRSELFVTSKLWNTQRGYDTALAAFEKTLQDLKLTYLDLYLIHWPASDSRFEDWEQINLDTWRALTELHKAGKIRAIGVSNFLPRHLKALMDTDVLPMVNQIGFHPGCMQSDTVRWCQEHDILVEAWSPLGSGRVLNDPLLKEMAEKYGRSTAQVCVRWCLQHNVLPLPKSTTPSRIQENIDVFDFELSEEDMRKIDAMEPTGLSGLHPDTVTF